MVIEDTFTDERYSAAGNDARLVLRRRPLTAVTAVRVDGVVQNAATYERGDAGGLLYRRPTGDVYGVDPWPEGFRHIGVDYSAGYASVPSDLEQATVVQAAFAWKQTKLGGNRIGDRGTVLDAGGSAQYLTGAWAPGVRETLDHWVHRELG